MPGSSGALRTTRAAALSRIGLFALAHPELGTVLDEALRVVRETLGTDLCAVLELAPSGEFFHRRAVSGSIVEGPATVSGLRSLGAPVRCDRDRVLQVLSNLIGNALKFVTPPGGVEVGCAPRDSHGVFFVRDHGPGIRAEDLPRIFDRYWQGELPATQKKQGLGLGLAICREIVDAHDGRIWAESELGRGSMFSFELPLGGPQRDAAGERHP